MSVLHKEEGGYGRKASSSGIDGHMKERCNNICEGRSALEVGENRPGRGGGGREGEGSSS